MSWLKLELNFIGFINALIGKIKSILKILDPITFPAAISALPFKAEIILTDSSGADVPIETIVSPMIIVGIPNLFAILDAEPTKKSAPFISIANPTIIKI